jgi:hypothetical protein
MGELIAVYLTAHAPSYCTYEVAFAGRLAHPDFQAVREGLIAQGRHLAALRPDVAVMNSCHLVATLPTVVDGTARHRGVRTAQEAPDQIHGVDYDFPGDYALAAAVGRARACCGESRHAGQRALPAGLRHRDAGRVLSRSDAAHTAFVPSGSLSHLAMMLGVILESGLRFTATAHGYGPASGSGNYVISLAAQGRQA